MAGRKKEPINLVIAKGKKHLTKHEIEERKKEELNIELKDIKAPDYLNKKLSEEFYEISEKLVKVGIMTELDEDCLARYLISKQNYLQYTSLLNSATKRKKTFEMEKLMTMQDKAYKQARTSASDLGLTIASRCKLIAPAPIEKPKNNKFSKFGDINEKV